jgi:hypothetical protein
MSTFYATLVVAWATACSIASMDGMNWLTPERESPRDLVVDCMTPVKPYDLPDVHHHFGLILPFILATRTSFGELDIAEAGSLRVDTASAPQMDMDARRRGAWSPHEVLSL